MSVNIKKTTGFSSRTDKAVFEIAPYSPVFIGSGNKLKNGLDFFSSQSKTHLIDLNRLFRTQVHDLDELESAVFRSRISDYIRNSGLQPEDFVKETLRGDAKSEELSEPVKTGLGEPMIPGSSIKGSIRSALLSHFLDKQEMPDQKYLNLITRFDKRTNQRTALGPVSAGRKLEETLLTTFDRNDKKQNGSAPNYDIGRILRVGDAVFRPDDLEVFNVAVINEVSDGYQWFVRREGKQSKNTPSLYNATKISAAALSFDPDTSQPASFTISLDQLAAEHIKWKQPLNFHTIASACNKTSRNVLQNDLDYINDALADQSDLKPVIDSIEELLEMIDDLEKENQANSKVSWLQRIGWGSGYVSMTGAHASEQQREEIQKLYRLGRKGFEYPKSRRLVLDLESKPVTMMGWVLVEQL